MSTSDPVMRAREPAKPETWGEVLGVAFAALVMLAFAVQAVIDTAHAILSVAWVP